MTELHNAQKMFVKPKVPGTTVRQFDRDMQPLPQEGAWVVASTFWLARVLNGDVIETEPPSESPAPVSVSS